VARVFLTKSFSKWAERVGLLDAKLIKAVKEIEVGLVDANLGGSLFKKRVGLNNQGKSASLRTLIGFRAGGHAFFLYGFAKNEKASISKQEKEALKEMVKVLSDMNNESLKKAIAKDALREIEHAV